ncbi:MAG: glycerate kinase [Bifidobacterium sp.]|uniref:glycerate kinase family protein n=1 Tax=Bifidobacterium sp. TaxID=41200 RepID=UPI0039E7BF12
MRYLLAPDSFKESADATEVALAMQRGIVASDPCAQTRLLPLSDGGEGLTLALVNATNGSLRTAQAHDALGRPITATYGFLGPQPGTKQLRTAVIELAAASGIELIAPAERRATLASTFGTGELIMDAIGAGADRIVLGLGGSATTDGGSGLARACGFRFLDAYGSDIPEGGGALNQLDHITAQDADARAASIPIIMASDVTNPLHGSNGAAQIFGPQKGASPSQVRELDSALTAFADAIRRLNGRDVQDVPGAGAAGGSGAGLLGLFNAHAVPGIDLVLELVHGKEGCDWADIVITGEGSIDGQTSHGKVPSGIARLARSCGKPTIAVGGTIKLSADERKDLRSAGIVATFAIAPGAATLSTLLADARANIESTCFSIAGLVSAVSASKSGEITDPHDATL